MLGSFAVFIAAAPLIILYAMGYRLGYGDSGSAPVGVVLLESVPTRAQTFAAGEYIGRTPESVPNITAGTMHVRVALEDYVSWEKTIAVAPGRATEVRDIRLFPTDPVRTTLASDVATFSVAPNRRLLVVATDNNQLAVLDTEGTAVTRSVVVPEIPTALLWSPDSVAVLVTSSRSLPRMLSATTGRLTTLTTLRGAHDYAWDPRVSSRLLYVGADDGLHALNVATGATSELTADITEFATSSRHIFAISRTNTVRVHDLQGKLLSSTPSFDTPIAGIYVTPGGEVAARSVDGALYVVSPDGTANLIAPELAAAGWSPNGRMLFVQSDTNSLHVYNVRDERWPLSREELHLVQRLSRPITSVQWFAGGRHLLYQVNDEIIVTEIDTRDHPITYQVDSVNLGDAQAAVGEDGEVLFYLKDQQGSRDLIAAQLIVTAE
ncbi:hypothetical protein CL628_04455 [bacterium]|nr:hypothetical protein [bacterium]